MASIKIGSNNPSAIMFDKPTIKTRESLFDYYKHANDAGGYFVHGLWLAPVSPWGPYTWPWDLGVPNGALKDVNDGWARWGYVLDGVRKNITSGLRPDFPANISGDYHVAITIYYNTPNYTDENGATYLDLGDHPVIITFYDDRFDDYNWVLAPGAIAEWSEDKRTVTIYRIPSSHIVYQSNNPDKTIAKVRKDLQAVYADVTGLTYNYSTITQSDPASVECWDVKQGEEEIYHKDKTYENYLKKYGFIKEETINSYSGTGTYRVRSIKNPDNTINDLILHPITDLNEAISTTWPYLRWCVKPNNMDYWNHVKEWFANNTISRERAECRLFEGSNIDEITLNIDNLEGEEVIAISLHDILHGSQIKKVTLNLGSNIYVGSALCIFRHADYLKEIVSNRPVNGDMCDGMFEFCAGLETYPKYLIDWVARKPDNYNYNPTNSINYFAEYSYLKTIPSRTEDRFDDRNTIIPRNAILAFNGCSVEYLGPVIDCKYLRLERTKDMFNTWSLKDARIKNLNHFSWYLDGTVNGQGNLKGLNKESIDYLFDNLTDLRTHDPAKLMGPEHTFKCDYWEYSGHFKYDFHTITFTERTADNILKTYHPLYNFEIKVTGMLPLDYLTFGTDYVFIEDGTYTIQKTNSDYHGFYLQSFAADKPTSPVTIEIINKFDPANPEAYAADLRCPSTWGECFEGTSIFSKMTNEKGTFKDSYTLNTTFRLSPTATSGSVIYGNLTATNFRFKVEGLTAEDTLGVGTGSLETIANKFTEDGTYTIDSLSGTWGFKVFNEDTTESSKVKITFLGCDLYPLTEIEPKVTKEMVAAAYLKGWTTYVGGENQVTS